METFDRREKSEVPNTARPGSNVCGEKEVRAPASDPCTRGIGPPVNKQSRSHDQVHNFGKKRSAWSIFTLASTWTKQKNCSILKWKLLLHCISRVARFWRQLKTKTWLLRPSVESQQVVSDSKGQSSLAKVKESSLKSWMTFCKVWSVLSRLHLSC